VGKHRWISGVPTSPNAANADVRSTSAHERGRTTICAAHRHPEIDRPADPSPWAVKGTTALSPSPALWSTQRRGGGWVLNHSLPRRPLFSPTGQTVQDLPASIDVSAIRNRCARTEQLPFHPRVVWISGNGVRRVMFVGFYEGSAVLVDQLQLLDRHRQKRIKGLVCS